MEVSLGHALAFFFYILARFVCCLCMNRCVRSAASIDFCMRSVNYEKGVYWCVCLSLFLAFLGARAWTTNAFILAEVLLRRFFFSSLFIGLAFYPLRKFLPDVSDGRANRSRKNYNVLVPVYTE